MGLLYKMVLIGLGGASVVEANIWCSILVIKHIDVPKLIKKKGGKLKIYKDGY